MATPAKGHKEAFARFFEDPTREKLRDLLKENFGESSFLDFKESWPKWSALAKHILGFANTGAACIVVGVKEGADRSMTPVGLAELADKAAIHAGIKSFLPDDLQGRLTVLDFAFEASEYPALVGKRFQVMLVDYSPDHIPLLSKRDGEGIKAAAIYVRREGQTEEATHDELQRLINARIETRYSTSEEITLKQHIEQLKVLFSELPGRNLFSNLFRTFASLGEPMGEETDTFSAFMKRAVQIKKSIILREIGATPETLKAFRLVDQMTARPTEGAH